MAGFDPDAYLKGKAAAPASAPAGSGFDPDAYLKSKPASGPTPPIIDSSSGKGRRLPIVSPIPGAVPMLEAGLNAATGMIAKPVSDVAGMAAMVKDILGGSKPEDMDAGGFAKSVREGMTYQPRTVGGQVLTQYNPMALVGRGLDALGNKAERIAAPPGSGTGQQMAGAGLGEAIRQAPGLFGVKGGKAATEGVGNAMQNEGRRVYQSALKPDISQGRKGRVDPAIDTLLDEGINVSKGGKNKLEGKISDLNDRIDTIVASNPNLRVNRTAAANYMRDTLAKFQRQVAPQSDVASLQKVWDEFLDPNHPMMGARATVPVQVAQEIKRGTYKAIGDKAYGEMKGAEIEGQKAIALGLKEEIAKALPEVRPLNAQESKMLAALPMVERRVLMSANKNPMGMSLLASSPEKMVGFLADRSDLFKSLVARMLYKSGGAIKDVAPMAPALAAGAPGYIPQPPQQQDQ